MRLMDLFCPSFLFYVWRDCSRIDDNMPAIALCDVAQRMDWHHFISGHQMGVGQESGAFYKVAFSRRYRNTKANFCGGDGCRGGRAVLRSDISLGKWRYICVISRDRRRTNRVERGFSIWHTARPWAPSFEAQSIFIKLQSFLQGREISRFYLGGHSKGGNLAVYAATTCDEEVKRRIGKIYIMDGPGFLPDFMDTLDYDGVKDKILKLFQTSPLWVC